MFTLNRKKTELRLMDDNYKYFVIPYRMIDTLSTYITMSTETNLPKILSNE